MSQVAVCVACHPEHVQYLGHMLNSLRAQTYTDWECFIVVDGPLSDAEQYDFGNLPIEPRLRTHVLHQWVGVPIATNIAVAQTSAPYIVTFGADDWMMPTFLQRLMAFATVTGPPYVVRFTPARVVAPDGSWRDYRYPVYRREHMAHQVFIPGPALQPRALWERLRGLDPAWDQGATDWMYYIRAAAEHLISPVQLDEPLWCYRDHTGFRNHERGEAVLHRLLPEMRKALAGQRKYGEPIPPAEALDW